MFEHSNYTKAIIAACIKAGINAPDPEKQASWKADTTRRGNPHTPEGWLRYAVERLEEEGRDDLLRWYKFF